MAGRVRALLMVLFVGAFVVQLGACQVDPHRPAQAAPPAAHTAEAPVHITDSTAHAGDSGEPTTLGPRRGGCTEFPDSPRLTAHRPGSPTSQGWLAPRQASLDAVAAAAAVRPPDGCSGRSGARSPAGQSGNQLLILICVTRT